MSKKNKQIQIKAQPQAQQKSTGYSSLFYDRPPVPWRKVLADPMLRLSAVLIIVLSTLGIFGYCIVERRTTYVTWLVGPIVEIEQIDDTQVKLWCKDHSNAATVPQGNYSIGKTYVVGVNKKANGEYKILLVNEV